MPASEKPLPLQIWLQENIECSEQTVGSVKDSRSRFHLERLFLFSWVSCVMETETFPHLVCKKNEKLAIAAMPELWYSEGNTE